MIQKEFGNRLEATMVGFPVFRNKLPTPFDMYEQARSMGKGNEMKKVLFRTIHQDKVTGVLDRTLREGLIKEVGLNPKTLEERGWPAESLRRPLKQASSGANESRFSPRRRCCWTAILRLKAKT